MDQKEQFEKNLEKAPTWQRERFESLLGRYKDIKFTDIQKRYLLWLVQWDMETIETFESIFVSFEEQCSELR